MLIPDEVITAGWFLLAAVAGYFYPEILGLLRGGESDDDPR